MFFKKHQSGIINVKLSINICLIEQIKFKHEMWYLLTKNLNIDPLKCQPGTAQYQCSMPTAWSNQNRQ